MSGRGGGTSTEGDCLLGLPSSEWFSETKTRSDCIGFWKFLFLPRDKNFHIPFNLTNIWGKQRCILIKIVSDMIFPVEDRQTEQVTCRVVVAFRYRHKSNDCFSLDPSTLLAVKKWRITSCQYLPWYVVAHIQVREREMCITRVITDTKAYSFIKSHCLQTKQSTKELPIIIILDGNF